MLRWCFYILILLNSALWGQQPVDVIEVQGNTVLSEQALLAGLQLQPGQPLPEGFPEVQHPSLQALYRQHAYYEARLDSFSMSDTADGRQLLKLFIHEGRPLLLRTVVFHLPETQDRSLFLESIRWKHGTIWTDERLEKALNSTLDQLARNGYAAAEITMDSLIWQPEGVQCHCSVDPGQLIRLGSVSVQGNKLTQTRLILRESRLQKGSVYDPAAIDAAVERLNRLGYFKPVAWPQVSISGNEAGICFLVEEDNTYRFDGILGYVPPPDDRSSGYVTGQLEFSLRNLFGTGRNLMALWLKKDELSQSMTVAYEEPWIAGLPLKMRLAFEQTIQDSTYIRRNGLVEAAWAFNGNLEAGGSVNQTSVLPDSADGLRLGIPRSSALTWAGFIQYQSMNDMLNPSKGLSLRVSAEDGQKHHQAYLLPDMKKKEDLRRVNIDFEGALPVRKQHVIFLGLHYAEVQTTHADAGYQIRLGGTRTVRGYAEDAFSGHQAAWCNLEYRFLTGPRSRLFAFADGLYWESEAFDGLEQRWGFGFGLRISTRLGIMGVDYGIGQGDGWMQGKIHVGLINSF